MKNFLLFSSMLLISISNFSQNKTELGIFAGASYYLGDINPSSQFYAPAPAFGGLFKYNFNDRYSLKFMGLIGNLQADDRDFLLNP